MMSTLESKVSLLKKDLIMKLGINGTWITVILDHFANIDEIEETEEEEEDDDNDNGDVWRAGFVGDLDTIEECEEEEEEDSENSNGNLYSSDTSTQLKEMKAIRFDVSEVAQASLHFSYLGSRRK